VTGRLTIVIAKAPFGGTGHESTRLPHVLAAAERSTGERPSGERTEELVQRRSLTPLFV